MKSSKSTKNSSSIINSLRIQKQLTNNTLRNIVIGILTGLVIYYLLRKKSLTIILNSLFLYYRHSTIQKNLNFQKMCN